MQRVTDQHASIGFGLFDTACAERLRHVVKRFGHRDA
jgi:hypothetical protein